MTDLHDRFGTLKHFELGSGRTAGYYSLPQLEKAGLGNIARLPVCVRIVLESVLRNLDEKRVTEIHLRQLAGWQPRRERTAEVPFLVARILLQDFTGVPVLVDLAAMRSAVARLSIRPGMRIINHDSHHFDRSTPS